MSEYEYYEGLEGAGDDGTHNGPDSLYTDASGGDDNNLNTFTYEDAEWGPDVEEHETSTAGDEGGYDEGIEPIGAGTEDGGGLLDGLQFDLSDLDLGNLTDMTFDATYDLIGSDPDEQGWWGDLASDHNHDGAYETVSAEDPYVAL
jgi:hypothetical protein